MKYEKLEKGSILDLWGHIIEVLNSIEGLNEVTDERDLRRRLKEHLRWGLQGEVGVLDPKARGECVKLLLVPCSLATFYQRLFEVENIVTRVWALDLRELCFFRSAGPRSTRHVWQPM